MLIDPQAAERGYNLGLAYLCSSLGERGHVAKVLDLNNIHRGASLHVVRETVTRFVPDLIGISGVSWAFKSAVHVARLLRSFWNGPIVQGGIHASLVKERILIDHPEFSMVVVGEGEETLPELASTIENGDELNSVRGLIFRENERIVTNEARLPVQDLDSLPFPDFHPFGISKMYSYPLLTSRGCPYTCIFCLSPVLSDRKWRARSPVNVIEELKHAIRTYGIKTFNVRDDNLTLRMNRAKEFCDRLVSEQLDLRWSCNNGIFARWVDSELAKKMSQAGCVEVSLGIESLVPEIFDQVRKGEHLRDVRNAVRALKDAGIRIRGFFILGLPGDSFENAMFSYRMSLELGLDDYGWNTLLPFPGTGAYDWVQQNATTLPEDEWDMKHGMLPFETEGFTKEQRLAAYKQIAIRTGNYAAFYDYNQSIWRNAIPLTQVVLNADPRRLPSHMARMARKFLRSCRFVPTEGAYHLRGPSSALRERLLNGPRVSEERPIESPQIAEIPVGRLNNERSH